MGSQDYGLEDPSSNLNINRKLYLLRNVQRGCYSTGTGVRGGGGRERISPVECFG